MHIYMHIILHIFEDGGVVKKWSKDGKDALDKKNAWQ